MHNLTQRIHVQEKLKVHLNFEYLLARYIINDIFKLKGNGKLRMLEEKKKINADTHSCGLCKMEEKKNYNRNTFYDKTVSNS